VLVAGAAVAWKQLDRRPAWVMAVNATGRAGSRSAALAEERAALSRALAAIATARDRSPALQREAETREDAGRTFVETRTVLVRSEDERSLTRLYRDVRTLPGVTRSDPRRALRPPDFAFASLLIALLVGLAVHEPATSRDRAGRASASFVVLNAIALGFAAAGAVLAESGLPGYLVLAAAISLVPAIAWLALVRRSRQRAAAFGAPYGAVAALTVLSAAGWIARLAAR
jgi:hypothetical protein